jgi:hypothetical protein
MIKDIQSVPVSDKPGETPRKRGRYFFESLAQFQNWIDATPRTWSINSSVTHEKDMQWDLRAGYEGTCAMARDGWIEGAQKAQDTLKVFAPATAKPDTKTDFYGFRPHVPRYCAGAPDSMIRHTPSGDMG